MLLMYCSLLFHFSISLSLFTALCLISYEFQVFFALQKLDEWLLTNDSFCQHFMSYYCFSVPVVIFYTQQHVYLSVVQSCILWTNKTQQPQTQPSKLKTRTHKHRRWGRKKIQKRREVLIITSHISRSCFRFNMLWAFLNSFHSEHARMKQTVAGSK